MGQRELDKMMEFLSELCQALSLSAVEDIFVEKIANLCTEEDKAKVGLQAW